jgi:hypothetical protein
MRTTVDFDDDTAAAIEQLRRDDGIGVSEAANRLIRRGLLVREKTKLFRQRSHALGLKIDVSNVADALDLLEGPDAR